MPTLSIVFPIEVTIERRNNMFWNRIIDRKSLGNRLFGSVFYKFVSGTVGYAVAHKPYSLEAIQAKTLRKTRDNESRDNELSQENELGFLEKLSLMMTKKLNEQVNNYSQQGKYQQAIPFAGRALVIREKLLGDEHPLVAKSLNTMAELYRQMGESVRAEPRYRRALYLWKKTLGEEHPSFATSLNNLASLYVSTGEYARAKPRYRQALEIRRKTLGEEHPDVAVSLNNLAELYRRMGEYVCAEPLYRRALDIRKKTLEDEGLHYSFLDNLERAFQTRSSGQFFVMERPLRA
ncbi:MAG: hypothetical protein DRR08_15465 [Candidatus Parabeggiatoa sp. nov. 2]|nr:MAG: hypothetical protein B6247_12285 [Beggiatoa sp. 4572_84]RKZ58815.1 MAG: hypothetical protein DRR08_15465 [Gammaproteobacteria bacterium]